MATTTADINESFRKMGINEAAFYNSSESIMNPPQIKYGSLEVKEFCRLKQPEEENFRLKQIVADISLDKQMLRDANILAKFLLAPIMLRKINSY